MFIITTQSCLSLLCVCLLRRLEATNLTRFSALPPCLVRDLLGERLFLRNLSEEPRRAAHAVETKRGSNGKTRVVAVVVCRQRRRFSIEAHQFRDRNVR